MPVIPIMKKANGKLVVILLLLIVLGLSLLALVIQNATNKNKGKPYEGAAIRTELAPAARSL